MRDHVTVRIGVQDGHCDVINHGDGIAIRMKAEDGDVTAILTHESAWRLSDELARAVTMAAVARDSAKRG